MTTVSSPTPQQLKVESWTFYSIGVVLIFLRFWSRILFYGSWRGFQIEDYIMMLVLCIYTTLMVAINISGSTATNLLGPGELETLTPADIESRIYGSKIVILLEQCMLTTVWLTKACMLLLYGRLSQRLPHQLAIKIISAYTLLGFFACELTWFLNCRPLSGYWALPVPDPQCATYQHYVIVQGVFNLSSDMMMLAVGLPLLIKARVELKKKIILVCIFGLGFFVILAAVLSKYYNFKYSWTTIYMVWYIREVSTAIYVANIPMLWPMFRRVFKAGSFAGISTHGKTSGTGGSYGMHSGGELSRIRPGKMTDSGLSSNHTNNSSQERINKEPAQLEIETRLSFHQTIEEREIVGPANKTFDVESYGESRYKASISGGS